MTTSGSKNCYKLLNLDIKFVMDVPDIFLCHMYILSYIYNIYYILFNILS